MYANVYQDSQAHSVKYQSTIVHRIRVKTELHVSVASHCQTCTCANVHQAFMVTIAVLCSIHVMETHVVDLARVYQPTTIWDSRKFILIFK